MQIPSAVKEKASWLDNVSGPHWKRPVATDISFNKSKTLTASQEFDFPLEKSFIWFYGDSQNNIKQLKTSSPEKTGLQDN